MRSWSAIIAILCLTGSAYADNGPTTAPSHRMRHEREKVAFLGVRVTEAAPALRHQLGLPARMGLVVEQVLPGSAAAEAGLQRYDVLQKLDDQLLINEEQLSVLVRSHKPGDSVTLTLFRDGKSQPITVKLAERELPSPGEERDMPWHHMPWGPMHGMPWFHPGQDLPHEHGDGPDEGPMRHGHQPAPGAGAAADQTWKTGDETYAIVTRHAHHYLTVERGGQQVFEGLIDTPDQVDKLPTDIRDEVRKHGVPQAGPQQHSQLNEAQGG